MPENMNTLLVKGLTYEIARDLLCKHDHWSQIMGYGDGPARYLSELDSRTGTYKAAHVDASGRADTKAERDDPDWWVAVQGYALDKRVILGPEIVFCVTIGPKIKGATWFELSRHDDYDTAMVRSMELRNLGYETDVIEREKGKHDG